MKISKKLILPGIVAVMGFLGMAGGSIVSTLSASAATTNSANVMSTDTKPPTNQTPPDPAKGGHKGKNGNKEEILTGDTAGKVKSAALASNPDGSVDRVETDAEGATYEAHMKKSDGTEMTVKLDSNYKVTSTEDGPSGPRHQ